MFSIIIVSCEYLMVSQTLFTGNIHKNLNFKFFFLSINVLYHAFISTWWCHFMVDIQIVCQYLVLTLSVGERGTKRHQNLQLSTTFFNFTSEKRQWMQTVDMHEHLVIHPTFNKQCQWFGRKCEVSNFSETVTFYPSLG